MKYINLRVSPNNNVVELGLACSHSCCGQELKGNENYCPKCGSVLKKIPGSLDKDLLIALLNKNIDKFTEPIAAAPEAKIGPDDITADDWHDDAIKKSTSIVDKAKDNPRCPEGHNPETCKYRTPKDGCIYNIIGSSPVKLKMCTFRGDGYITLEDAY